MEWGNLKEVVIGGEPCCWGTMALNLKLTFYSLYNMIQNINNKTPFFEMEDNPYNRAGIFGFVSFINDVPVNLPYNSAM